MLAPSFAFRLVLATVLVALCVPSVLGQAESQELIGDTTMKGEPSTPTGDIIGDIYVKIIWASIAVFVLVAIVMAYILIRFAHRKGKKVEVPHIHGHSKLEIAWTIGPALVMIWLLVISYDGLMKIDYPEADPEVFIDVTASRFSWEFRYQDNSTAAVQRYTTGGVELPFTTLRVEEDTWVQVNVTSIDVIHAFTIPGLDIIIDANPGRMNKVQFNAREPGPYLVQCRQFCGAGHGEMLAAVEVFQAGSQPRPYGAAPSAGMPTPDNNTTGPQADRTIEIVSKGVRFTQSVPVQAEPGEVVEIVLVNDDPFPHNIYIGDFATKTVRCDTPGDDATCWRTNDVVAGNARDSFTITMPDEPIAFDLWCNVPGHAPPMIDILSVGGATKETGEPDLKLPGPGPVLLLVSVVGAALLLRRRSA